MDKTDDYDECDVVSDTDSAPELVSASDNTETNNVRPSESASVEDERQTSDNKHLKYLFRMDSALHIWYLDGTHESHKTGITELLRYEDTGHVWFGFYNNNSRHTGICYPLSSDMRPEYDGNPVAGVVWTCQSGIKYAVSFEYNYQAVEFKNTFEKCVREIPNISPSDEAAHASGTEIEPVSDEDDIKARCLFEVDSALCIRYSDGTQKTYKTGVIKLLKYKDSRLVWIRFYDNYLHRVILRRAISSDMRPEYVGIPVTGVTWTDQSGTRYVASFKCDYQFARDHQLVKFMKIFEECVRELSNPSTLTESVRAPDTETEPTSKDNVVQVNNEPLESVSTKDTKQTNEDATSSLFGVGSTLYRWCADEQNIHGGIWVSRDKGVTVLTRHKETGRVWVEFRGHSSHDPLVCHYLLSGMQPVYSDDTENGVVWTSPNGTRHAVSFGYKDQQVEFKETFEQCVKDISKLPAFDASAHAKFIGMPESMCTPSDTTDPFRILREKWNTEPLKFFACNPGPAYIPNINDTFQFFDKYLIPYAEKHNKNESAMRIIAMFAVRNNISNDNISERNQTLRELIEMIKSF